MLVDPAEEQLDLPAGAMEGGDGQGGQIEAESLRLCKRRKWRGGVDRGKEEAPLVCSSSHERRESGPALAGPEPQGASS